MGCQHITHAVDPIHRDDTDGTGMRREACGNTRDIGPLAWRAVRDAGFTHAFTTISGSLTGAPNPWLLPRYGIGPADTRLASLVPLLFAGNRRLRQFQARLAN